MSHIIPKWAYQPLKNEGAVISSRFNGLATGVSQDGDKHYLLCEKCEQHLGSAEKYLREICFLTPSSALSKNLILDSADRHAHRLIDIDESMMWRALLGIALKVHFSPSFAGNIKPLNLLSSIRAALLKDDYSTFSGPSFGFKWMMAEGISPRGHIMASFDRGRDNRCLFRTKLGGIEWQIFLNDTSCISSEDDWAKAIPLWAIFTGDIRNSALLFPDFWEEYNGDPSCCSASDEDRCPCDSGAVFAACCKGFWCGGNQ
ncbi:hypothetical protein GT020_05965 [Glutamicibacter soli]|uniref:DUF4238 domain-containing protein n=1 Tax=Glutamicibacter soli TaxID=453836 RepID=A0A6L9G338_9MICC|nr:hypothetical protein [Glutamicibacter soli]NAZ15614.1 hypothetical protein [Glutamicibacter soli]